MGQLNLYSKGIILSILQQLKQILPPRRPKIPVFPLHAVLFPGGILSLKVFEQRYMDMTKACLKHNDVFGVSLIQEGQEVGIPAVPEAIGCTAKIIEWDMQELGILEIRVVGQDRFRLLDSTIDPKGLITGNIELIPADIDAEIPERYAACVELLRKIMATNNAKAFAEPLKLDSASWVSNRLAEVLPLKIVAKQKLMELSDPLIRLDVLAQFLIQKDLI